MGYIYRHIRLDNNEVFYIGLGGFYKNEKEGSYKRAYNKYKRSKFWNAITCKTKYEVEIMIDNLDFETACDKEKEFISIYGRRDLGLGTLVNLTDGGDGRCGGITSDYTKKLLSEKAKITAIGRKHTEETKDKISKIQIGKKASEETKKKMSESQNNRNIKTRISCEIDGILYKSFYEASKKLNINRKVISSRCYNTKYINYKINN